MKIPKKDITGETQNIKIITKLETIEVKTNSLFTLDQVLAILSNQTGVTLTEDTIKVENGVIDLSKWI
jgi:hypothetical protein